MTNQCDGCLAGIPVDANGNHHMAPNLTGVYSDLMACQAPMYAVVPPEPEAPQEDWCHCCCCTGACQELNSNEDDCD